MSERARIGRRVGVKRTEVSRRTAKAERVSYPTEVLTPKPYRGRLLNAEQVATEMFHDHVSATWVRRNVPNKIRLGHSTLLWYEYDVLDFIHQNRED